MSFGEYRHKQLTREFSWFLCFAIINFCTNIFLTAILHEWFLVPVAWAFAASLLVAYLVSFGSFRYVVFDNARSRPAVTQMLLFLITSFCLRGAEFIGFSILHLVIGFHYLLSIFASLTVSFFGKFFFYRQYVFGRRAIQR